MKVLVVGQGGREHALVWKLAQSPLAPAVYCAPGNAGTGEDGINVPIAADDSEEIVRFSKKESIDLVVVGPEAPLVNGLSDDLRQAGIAVFGPSREAALLEGSKVFSKRLMRKAGVPTADFHVFEDLESVEVHLEAHPGPCVVKADGLAAGKGVVVCADASAARSAARRMLVDEEFGKAGARILVEERLEGPEASVFAITDGSTILCMEPCQDHKRAFDGDQGPNTGGMGAYCPAPIVTPEILRTVERDVLVPIVHFLRKDHRPYQGVLYAGLLLTVQGPKVLEFNVRFGDPECQPLLMRLKTDLLDVLWAATRGELDRIELEWDPRPAVAVVLASGGYPSMYRMGLPITGLEKARECGTDVKVFHAGTRRDGSRIRTDGGRVLAVTALGADLAAARRTVYEVVPALRFTDAMYRTDIALRALEPAPIAAS